MNWLHFWLIVDLLVAIGLLIQVCLLNRDISDLEDTVARFMDRDSI